MAKQKLTNENLAKLRLRLKADIKESKRQEKQHKKEGYYNNALEEIINQENFMYFQDLLRQATLNKWD